MRHRVAPQRQNNPLVGLILLVEPGRPVLAISPVENEVFIEADIGGTGRVISRQPVVCSRSRNRRRWRCHRLKRFEVDIHGARDVAGQGRGFCRGRCRRRLPCHVSSAGGLTPGAKIRGARDVAARGRALMKIYLPSF